MPVTHSGTGKPVRAAKTKTLRYFQNNTDKLACACVSVHDSK